MTTSTDLTSPDYVPGETFEEHIRRHGCVLHPNEWTTIVGHHEVATMRAPQDDDEQFDMGPVPPLPAPVPVAGMNAWFISIEDRKTVFAVPVTCLMPSWNSYSGHPEEPLHIEWGPAIITAGGFISELNDNVTMPAVHRGILIGCAPSTLDQEAALAHLELMTVCGPGDADVGRYTEAQMRLDGRLPFAEKTYYPAA